MTGEKKKNNTQKIKKPMIVHCRNCAFCEFNQRYWREECQVKYTFIHDGRKTALFCRHYRERIDE